MSKARFTHAVLGRAFKPKFAAAALALAALAPGRTETAAANGDTRTISLFHSHTQESIVATFRVNGAYDQATLEKLNWFLRDWRRDEPTKMDPRLFDAVWETYRESGSQQPIVIVSAYRSPETNAMLRHRSRAVAEFSQHMLGKAMDMHYQDVPMSRVREIAMHLQRGGVGYYPTANSPFVHMDVGGVRAWPRMGYDQLARLFPDGKTVHIAADGRTLARYEDARAEVEARNGVSVPTVAQVKSKGFFALLFGGGEDDESQPASGAPAGPRVGGDARVSGFIARSRDTNAATRVASASAYAPASPGSSSEDGNPLAFLRGALPQSAPAAAPERRPAPLDAEAPPPQQTQIKTNSPTEPSTASSLAAKPAPIEAVETTIAAIAPTPPRRPAELAYEFAPTPPLRAIPAVPAIGPAALSPPPQRLAAAAPPQPVPGAEPALGLGSTTLSSPPLPRARANRPADPDQTRVAKLDRANFRQLTAPVEAAHIAATAVAPSIVGLRRASRFDVAPLLFAPPAGVDARMKASGSSLAVTSVDGAASLD